MPAANVRFTFNLPYHINVVGGQVSKDLVIPLGERGGKVTIHPLKLDQDWSEPSFQSPEKSIWYADKVEIDVEMELASTTRLEIDKETKPIAMEYFERFLRYCRARTGQYWIDFKETIEPHVSYVDEVGQKHRYGTLVVEIEGGEPPSLDNGSWEVIYQDLVASTKVPFYEELLLEAKLYRRHHDYRMAVVSAAMSIEAITSRYLKERLTQKLVDANRTSDTQVNRFLSAVSNRLLVTVGLGLFSRVERKVLEDCRDALDLRNKILHGEKKSVSREEANLAISGLESLVSADEIRDTLKDEVG